MNKTYPIFGASVAAWLSALTLMTSAALAADTEIHIAIENNRFVPAEIKVPAGQRIKLLILNKDRTAEEFESYTLNVEKIIPGGKRGLVFIGPLAPGRYTFFGEFHQDTAQGVLLAE